MCDWFKGELMSCLNAANNFLLELWDDLNLTSASTSVNWAGVEMISKLTSSPAFLVQSEFWETRRVMPPLVV